MDGPGIRYVVFFRGCPLRCRYCHNPDTWESGGEAREAADIVADALRYRSFLKGGGITATGGEPLAQPAFLAELFRLAKEAGFHTCLDTSGGVFSAETAAEIDRVLDHTDLVLLDIKHADDAAHRRLTGVSNRGVLAFAAHLDERKIPVWIRHVVVPGITDGEDSARAVGAIVGGLSNVAALDVLPYHTMGAEKYARLGMPPPLPGVPAATEAQALAVREWILDERKKTKRGEKPSVSLDKFPRMG